jgi:Flp pilus assembly protein CpaB
MLKRSTFGRQQRGVSSSVLLQFVVLSVVFFVCIIGVVAFVHLSSSKSDASTETIQTQVSAAEGYVEVLVPVQTIPAGVALKPEMFKVDRKIESLVSSDTPRSFEEIRGQYTRGVLLANQVINIDYLTTLQPVNALTASIPAGHRAIAISVDATSAVEGWAQAGARVDVIWVTSYSGRRTVSVVASNAKVLSANRKIEGTSSASQRNGGGGRGNEKPKQEEVIPATVTLLLSAHDAMRVRLAALHGRLSLGLRGTEDSGVVENAKPLGEGVLFKDINQNQMPAQPRNFVDVTVKDPTTGAQEKLIFENGQRVYNQK